MLYGIFLRFSPLSSLFSHLFSSLFFVLNVLFFSLTILYSSKFPVPFDVVGRKNVRFAEKKGTFPVFREQMRRIFPLRETERGKRKGERTEKLLFFGKKKGGKRR